MFFVVRQSNVKILIKNHFFLFFLFFFSPQKTLEILPESAVMMDEEDEDDEEEYLNIGTEIEIDPDSPPWDMYGEHEIDDIDDTNEDTALLRTKIAKTEIIVTPISPVS